MIIRLISALGIAVLTCTGVAHAQCLTIDSASLPAPYNPFSSSGIDQTVSLTVRGGGSEKASAVFVRKTGDNRPYDIIMVSDDGGSGGTSVVYNPPGPDLKGGDHEPGELEAIFKGQPIRTAQIRVTAPANTQLPAGLVELVLDVKYKCDKPRLDGVNVSGLILRLTVLSALQASFVGTALDFGEVSHLTTAQVAGAPDSTRVTSAVRVASSGPYEVMAESQNGWVMTPSGGPTSAPDQKIGYELQFLGRTARPGQDFAKKTCSMAGVAGVFLPIGVSLVEGGAGKVPSPAYQDVLTVTVTPLGATTPSPEACP